MKKNGIVLLSSAEVEVSICSFQSYLNAAPKIMCCIVIMVLSMNEQVRSGTDLYLDEIIVDEPVVDCKKVISVVGKVWFGVKTACEIGWEQSVGLTLVKSRWLDRVG